MNPKASTDIIETLYEEYSPYLKTRANRIIHDRELCEDIVHDCMIKAILHRELLESLNENQRRKYLTVTVDNLAKNYAARTLHEYILLENIPEEFYILPESVEEAADSRLKLESVLEALKTLNARDRDIIIMKYSLHMPDREIAPVFHIKENSVRMTVRRSVFYLKKKLGIVKKYETVT